MAENYLPKQDGIVPAPLGVMMLLEHYKVETEGSTLLLLVVLIWWDAYQVTA